MLQNTQQYPQTGTDLQSLPGACDADPLAQVDTLKMVTCPVCRAIYVPSGEQQEHHSTTLLETAFLDVCRSCFRCQRPACPQCWNPVHHACASCSEEARLPFRSPVPSLEGLVFLPPTSARTPKFSFVCQRNGRFYTPEPAQTGPKSQEVAPLPAPTTSEPVTSDELPVLQSGHAAPAPVRTQTETYLYPVWLQEVLGQKVHQSVAPTLTTGEQPLENPATMQPPVQPAIVWSQTRQANWPALAPNAQQQIVPASPHALPISTSQPLPAASVGTSQSEIESQDEPTDDISLFERIENVLIVITSILLLAVVLMIVLSISSAQVNAFFLHLLHIDIRTEIAYLLQLR